METGMRSNFTRVRHVKYGKPRTIDATTAPLREPTRDDDEWPARER